MRLVTLLLAAALAGCTVHLHADRVVLESREGVAVSTSYAVVGRVENHVHGLHAAQVNMVERVEVMHGY